MTDVLARLAIRQQVTNCTACQLCRVATRPVPFSGPSPSTIAIIGEAPGRYEDVSGKAFVGPSGQLARKWLADAGITDEVAWLNVVSCYPNRTPTSREVDACQGNFYGQLAVIQPDFCLVFGGIAVGAIHSGTRLGEVRGLWWRLPYVVTSKQEVNGVVQGNVSTGPTGGELVRPAERVEVTFEAWTLATWHPAAVLRNRGLEAEVVADIARFRQLHTVVSTVCIKCRIEPAVEWVNDLGYCYKHNLFRKGEAYGRRAKFAGEKAVKQPGRKQTRLL